MRHGVESQGLFEQVSIKLQELARVCRACIRHDKADIQILRMLGEPQDEALFREVHREGAELNTEVSCDIASDLIKQSLSPGHQHELDPGSRDLSCEFDAYSGRGTGNERPRPELLFVKQRFHTSSPLYPPKLVNCSATCCSIVSVSQRVDPILKAPHFHHHHLGVVGTMRHRSHTLKGGEEMHCKFTCVLIVAGGPELLFKPADGLNEEPRGLLRQSTALLVQLGAQAAKLTSSARKLLPVRVDATHDS